MSAVAPRIRLPYPHLGQQTVRRQARRFNWLAAGRRWRKTTMAMTISVESAAAGQTVIWGAPTYNQVRIGMEETRRAAAGVADFNLSRMEVSFPLGGRILFRSLDNPDNARGLTGDGIVIDEAGIAKPYAWYEVLRPMLIDTGGWLWAIGTPNGRNWFWTESMAALDRADAMAWQVPTLGVENQTLAASFATLCVDARSQHDYIALSRLFHTVMLFDVPVMTGLMESEARRFIALVDEFYERHVKLVVSAAVPLYEVYQGERLKFEFQRCLSRLQEMQSEEYLKREHLAG